WRTKPALQDGQNLWRRGLRTRPLRLEEDVGDGLGRAGRLIGAAQLQPSRRDPQVEIRFRPPWEVRQNVVLADQVGDRFVDIVVPAGTCLGDTDLAVLLQAHEIAVPENVFEDSVVAAEPAGRDRGLRA